MKKIIAVLASAAAAVSVLVVQPAAAHSNIHILGYQFAYDSGLGGAGVMGYVNTPAGPVAVDDGLTEDGINGITNRDAIAHTFTECLEPCGQPATLPRFDIPLASGASGSIPSLQPGNYFAMCRIHTWMRARFTLIEY